MNDSTVRIPIIGLGCGGSDPAILEKALARLPAVRHAYVNPVTESAYLTVDATRFRMDDALNEIARCGYHGLSADRERDPTVLDDNFADLMFGHLVRAEASDDERRVERIATEALEAFRRLADVRRAVSVFGSARSDAIDQWGELARETARALGEAGFAVITGGGPGLMECANEGARRAGISSVGLTIQLPFEEHPNPYLDVHVPFHYFFLRKLAFVKYACAFVCLPGGFGTFDELFEALNLRLTTKVAPFPVLLVGSEFWGGLRDWMESTCVSSGTLTRSDLDSFEITDDPEVVVARVVECHETLCRTLGIRPG